MANAVAGTNERGQAAQLATLMSEARQGNPLSQLHLGVLELTGRCGRIADYALGAKWIFEAAKQLPHAQYVAAILLSAGTGVRQNETEAHAMLERSAGGGSRLAETIMKKREEAAISGDRRPIYQLSGAVQLNSDRKTFIFNKLFEAYVSASLYVIIERPNIPAERSSTPT